MNKFLLISVLLAFSFFTVHAGESIRGIPSTGKVAPRDLPSMANLPTLTETEIALRAARAPRIFPEGRPISEEQLEELKEGPQPSVEGKGILTIDKSAVPGSSSLRNALSLRTPALTTSFEGNLFDGSRPGDLMVAVGPMQVVSTTNSTVRIRSKTGTVLQTVSANTFFGNSSANFFDPKVAYDLLGGRFILLFDDVSESSDGNLSRYWVAISKTSDAMGAWTIYQFDMTIDGGNPTNNWADFPGLGFDDHSVYMTANMFSFPLAADTFRHVKTRVLDKLAMYDGLDVGYVDIVGVPGTGPNFTLKPAMSLSSTTEEFLVITNFAGGNTCDFYHITGAPSNPLLEKLAQLTVVSYGVPPDGVQLDCASNKIETNDARAMDPVWRDGFFHTVNCVGTSIGGSVSAVKYIKINTSTNTVATDETFGASGTFYSYPAVTVDAAGTAFFSFSRSSATEYASAWFSGKRRSDDHIQPSALLKAGTQAYWCNTALTRRWGDYEGVSIDPSETGDSMSSAWVDGNWAKSGITWGSWIGKISVFYHRISGTVYDDCDSNAGTSADRLPLPLMTVVLHKDSTDLIGSTQTDSLGRYSFGLLEDGVYDVSLAIPPSGASLDAMPGSGGASQVRLDDHDLRVVLTGAETGSQFSTGNDFAVVAPQPVPATTGISPDENSTGEPGFTLAVHGSGFTPCSVVRVDGEDRQTAYVSGSEIQAAIPASDLSPIGQRHITVFNRTPGGGLSNEQLLDVHAPAPKYSASPHHLPFGALLVGMEVSDSVVVTNPGTATLTVSSASSDNPQFLVSPPAGTIPRQGSMAFTVTYHPSAPAPASGRLILVHDASPSPDSVELDGTGIDSTSYRTATSEDWATSVDAKNKHKGMPRKPDKVNFTFSLTAPSNLPPSTSLTLVFNIGIGRIHLWTSKSKTDSIPLRGPVVVDAKRKLWRFDILDGVLLPHQEIQADGIGSSGKRVSVKYQWLDAALALKRKGVVPDSLSRMDENRLGLPKPNLNNVGEELFPKGFGQPSAFFSSPLIVGVPRGPKSAASVKIAKYANVLKSLIDTKLNKLHTEGPVCLARFTNGDSIKAQQTSLPPAKQNNVIFAELLALRLNIGASATHKFPVGLGELTFDDQADPGNPFNGQTLGQIAAKADTLIACLPLTSKGPTPALSDVLDVIEKINSAFADEAMYKDTVTFAAKTVLPGVKPVGQVPFLHATPGIVPLSVPSPDVTEGLPAGFALLQNYPNPFNPVTTVSFVIGQSSLVTLKVYDVLGREVATLLNRELMEEGDQEVEFDGSNVASGVYFYRVVVETAPDGAGSPVERFTDVKKMLLVR